MKRAVIITLAVLVLVALAGPFLPLDFLRPGIAGALARALGRQVDIDGVSLTLFPAPALALSGVTIHEDPRAGVEPFTYAENVDAQVDLMGLFGGRRKFSRLRFTGASLNLVKTASDGSSQHNLAANMVANVPDGPWNFQYLLNSAASVDVPAVQMRAGRVNIKFGQVKSVLFFADADLDISVGEDGAVDLRFSGEPARTDRPAEEFGHFFVRGTVAPSSTGQQTNMRVELEPSSLDGLARLLGATGFDLQGQLALNGQIVGPATNLEIKGDVEFDYSRRTSVLPQFGGKVKLGLHGVLDATRQRLQIESVAAADQPFSMRFEASNFLVTPQWASMLALTDVPLAAIYGAARQIGAPLPDKLMVGGAVNGCVEVSSSTPLSGELTLSGLTLALAEAPPMKAETASVSIRGSTITLARTMIDIGDRETATLEATYKAGAAGEADVKITTRGLTVAATRGLDLSGVALLGQVPEGTWRGAARFQHLSTGENTWSGEYELINARVDVDGLAEPIRIVAATVSTKAERTVVSRLRASAGKIAFAGDYRWEPMAQRPHQFRIRIDQADGAEVERLFKPTLERVGGFLERTLGLGAAPPPPDWLAGRRADGTFLIRELNVAGRRASVDAAHLVWDGTGATITGLKGRVDDTAFQGTITADLSGRTPQYHLDGRMDALAFSGGTLDIQGVVDASGTGAKLLSSLQAQGTLDGRTIEFAPDAEFRNVTGKFDARIAGGLPRWKFSGVEAVLGGETYTGGGGSQPDGKIVLDLASRGRQVRFTGSLLAAPSAQ